MEGEPVVDQRPADHLVHRVVAADVLAGENQFARGVEQAGRVEAAGLLEGGLTEAVGQRGEQPARDDWPRAGRRRRDRDLLDRPLAADPARARRVEAPLAGITEQRPLDLDHVRGMVGCRAGPMGSIDQPLAVKESQRQLLVVAGGAHRDRQRPAVDANLERFLGGDEVLTAVVLDPPPEVGRIGDLRIGARLHATIIRLPMPRAFLISIVAAVVGLAVPTAQAQIADSGGSYSDWNPSYIGFPSNAEREPRVDCESGSDDCIRRTLGEMWRRFHTVVPACDDNGLFSLTYIRVTEDISEAVDSGFYPDLHWINHQDAIFARMYFLAYDNWRAGRLDLVPPAWRIAFGASENREVEGMGNLLLSMNAHITRDMPYILYHSGLVTADGESRYGQHTAYNSRLRELYTPVIKEMSRRFDDSMDNYDVPGLAADDEALFSVLRFWRQQVWQNAERLVNAESEAELRQVAADIEAYAVAQAQMIYAGTAYLPVEDSTARAARCAEHGGQRPAYERGSQVARPAGATAGGGTVRVRLTCPEGVGPCVGDVKAGRGARRGFSIPATGRETVRIPGTKGSRLHAVSKLAPGDAVSVPVRVG